MKHYVFASSCGQWKSDDNGDGTVTRYFDGPVMVFDSYSEADATARSNPKYSMVSCDPREKVVCKPIKTEFPAWMTVER